MKLQRRLRGPEQRVQGHHLCEITQIRTEDEWKRWLTPWPHLAAGDLTQLVQVRQLCWEQSRWGQKYPELDLAPTRILHPVWEGRQEGSRISEKARLTATENPHSSKIHTPIKSSHLLTSLPPRCVPSPARQRYLQHFLPLVMKAADKWLLGAQAVASDCLGLTASSIPP